MSLRVWLPLNGDLHNQGLSDLTFSIISSNITINNNGKIGKCYNNNSNSGGGIISNKAIELGTNVSMCCWFKFTSLEASASLGGGLVSQHCYNDNTGLGITIRYVSSTTGYISCSTGTGSSRTYNTYYGTTLLQADTWYHATLTYDGSLIKLYLNGILEKTQSYAQKNRNNYIAIFAWSVNNGSIHGDYKLNGYLNDVRIYDHCLSAKEVKEISKGLVCHYKLDNKYSTNNLIINGFGENGAENWISSNNISTTEIPSSHPEIKASYYNGNIIKEYIPINPNHSYTISAYLKTTGATTGATYPSIYPYDYDKKFIWTYNCSEGFSTQYKTTLAQPLKKGDTVIYATNLSAWTTANTNYYFHVAIFGYKDSSGYTYPDMIYTADSPAFGTKTDKSHIDKTNNTITLNAPFAGEDRPAGTTICQATEGSTYYYPFNGVTLASIQDWTFKTTTFTPKSHKRLKACKYIKWQAYSGAYYAGNKLVDNNDNNSVIYDCSGYNHHGTRMTDTLSCSTNTARNSLSTNFNGTNDGILIENLDLSPIINNSATYSFWIKPNGENGTRSVYFGMYSGTSWSIEKTTGNVLRSYWAGSPDETCSGATIADGVWQHICIVKDGANSIKVYINGVLKWTSTATHSNKTFATICRIGRDTRSGDGTPYKGLMSDFRIYATALSEDDIKELYQTSASIDKNGNVFAYEFKED